MNARPQEQTGIWRFKLRTTNNKLSQPLWQWACRGFLWGIFLSMEKFAALSGISLPTGPALQQYNAVSVDEAHTEWQRCSLLSDFWTKTVFLFGSPVHNAALRKKSPNLDNRSNTVVKPCQGVAVLLVLEEKWLFSFYHLGRTENIKGLIDIFFSSSLYVKTKNVFNQFDCAVNSV